MRPALCDVEMKWGELRKWADYTECITSLENPKLIYSFSIYEDVVDSRPNPFSAMFVGAVPSSLILVLFPSLTLVAIARNTSLSPQQGMEIFFSPRLPHSTRVFRVRHRCPQKIALGCISTRVEKKKSVEREEGSLEGGERGYVLYCPRAWWGVGRLRETRNCHADDAEECVAGPYQLNDALRCAEKRRFPEKHRGGKKRRRRKKEPDSYSVRRVQRHKFNLRVVADP